MKQAKHKPVLVTQVIDSLKIQPAEWYIDATFGRGGHTRELLKASARVLALDVDSEAISYGKRAFAAAIDSDQLVLRQANFTELDQEAQRLRKSIRGILFDFGTSIDQLTSSDRGFSFEGDGPLDMRMDERLGVTAADLLAALSEKQLSSMFKEFGGEDQHRAIARKIVQSREEQPITTTSQLVAIIQQVKRRRGKLHPATKVFQALRIAVNTELDAITQALPKALKTLAPGGRLVAISFHEGEDRLVKQAFKSWEAQQHGTQLTKKPITASDNEITQNPAARSAKLRVFEKAS